MLLDKKEKMRDENVTTLPCVLLLYGVEKFLRVVKGILQDQSCVLSLKKGHGFIPRREFVASAQSLCLMNDVNSADLINVRFLFCNTVQCVISGDTSKLKNK